ncbi:MAG TPA: hypothetical protein V6C57_13075 [Coleofasciculaceae cyanobacterium]
MKTSGLTQQAIAFANLGQLWQSAILNFAESIAVTDPEVLREVRSLLDEEVGGVIQRVFDLTIDPATNTFMGKAEQKLSLAKSQFYQFTMSPTSWDYKLIPVQSVNPSMSEFDEGSDEDWMGAIEFAASKSARASKKLNCKPGNTQCGGKCQDGKKNCKYKPTPEQSKSVEAIATKAKKSTPRAKAEPVPKTESKPVTSKPSEAVNTSVAASNAITPIAASSMFEGHVVGTKSRVDQPSLEKALDSIPTEGAAARVEAFRAFANKHEVQAAFWDTSPGARYTDQVMAIAAGLKNVNYVNGTGYRNWLEFDEGIVLTGGDRSKQIKRGDPEFLKAITPSVSPLDGVNGYTIPVADHVFVNIRNGRSGDFAPSVDDMNKVIKRVIRAHDVDLKNHSISTSANDPDFGTLATYLHESGHQVHFKANKPTKPPDAKTLTGYGETDKEEWFAEHFAAYVLDGEAYKAFDPIGHKFVEDTLKTAIERRKE